MDLLKPIGTVVTATLLAASVWMTAQKPLPAIQLEVDKPAVEAEQDYQESAVEARTTEREACSETLLTAPKLQRTRGKIIGHV